MLQGTAEPVQLPHDQRVSVAGNQWLQPGPLRESTAPLATSRKIFSHPAFWRASSCKSGFWSAVETRA
jgi:hypothetical protein